MTDADVTLPTGDQLSADAQAPSELPREDAGNLRPTRDRQGMAPDAGSLVDASARPEDDEDGGTKPTATADDRPFLTPSEPEPPRRLVAPADALDVTSYGARPGSDCTESIQRALNGARAGDTVLVPAADAPYLLRDAGVNPFLPGSRFALRVPPGVTLFIAPEATLKLADSQQTDASGAIDLIVFSGDSITVTGGGTIVGNTAGQTAWTGRRTERFQQIEAGCLLRGFKPLARVRISDLHLLDSFSNPVNLNADDDIAIERLVTSGNGEGPQVIDARNVSMSDLDHDDLSDVSQGDGVEVSNVEGFSMRRVRVRASAGGAGSAVDVYGSRNGIVEDVEIRGWSWGIDVHDYPDLSAISDGIELRRIWITDAEATAILSNRQRGSTRLDTARISHSGIGIQALGGASEPQLLMTHVTVEDCIEGFLVQGSRSARLESSKIAGSVTDGVAIAAPMQAPASRVELIDVSVNDSQGHGVVVEPSVMGELTPQVVIEGGDYTRNAAGAYGGLPLGSRVERAVPSWP